MYRKRVRMEESMKSPVIIKGTKSGIIVHLDDKMSFDDLKKKSL